jgi:hypothetical protein
MDDITDDTYPVLYFSAEKSMIGTINEQTTVSYGIA